MALRLPLLRAGHELKLLEGTAEYFPALVAAIDGARHEVLLETYIFDFTGDSVEVATALERAARRGVIVRVAVDGFGTPTLPDPWRERFAAAGVQLEVYAPLHGAGVIRPGNWRRLHRKLCAVDGELAFCGGINLLDDLHDPNHGPLDWPRLDYAVRLVGPVAQDVHEAMLHLWQRVRAGRHAPVRPLAELLRHPWPHGRRATLGEPTPDAAPGATARAALLLRDNLRNRTHIEKAYLRAIGRAQQEIIIANAYFVPGGRLRRALAAAARRGVQVVLLLQGRYEYFMQYYASRPVYDALLKAGVEIHEYSPSFLHAKVAVFDGYLATVGSSNLDPLSLLLAREANVMVDDVAFAGELRGRLLKAIREHGRQMDPVQYARRPWRERALERVALVAMRLALAIQGKKYL